MIIGHGVDLVDTTSIRQLVADPVGHFVDRCFTATEQAAAGDGPNRLDRLAGRFAAKEAVLKALGTGFGGGIGFVDVEILTLPSGAPSVTPGQRATASNGSSPRIPTAYNNELLTTSRKCP